MLQSLTRSHTGVAGHVRDRDQSRRQGRPRRQCRQVRRGDADHLAAIQRARAATSVLVRVPVAQASRADSFAPSWTKSDKRTVACEPVVSVLTDVAKQLAARPLRDLSAGAPCKRATKQFTRHSGMRRQAQSRNDACRVRARRIAAKDEFIFPLRSIDPTGKSAKLCPAPRAKTFRFNICANQLHVRRRPAPLKGRFAIVTDAGRDAVDAEGAGDESAFCGRRSRVVLTPRRWRQVCGKRFPQSDGGKKADRRGEHDISRKTIAWGMPGDSGVT